MLAGCTQAGSGTSSAAGSASNASTSTTSASSSSAANSLVEGASSSAALNGSSAVDTSLFTELSDTQFYFDTVCQVTGTMTQDILDSVFDRCAFFQATLSAQEEGSDIDRINKAGGKPVEVQPETAEVIQKAMRYCEESGGLFDITIGAASLLWDFKEGVVPDTAELEEAITHIDYRKVSVNGTTVQLDDPAAKLDVGGVAKGYIADDLIALLQSQGVQSAFVNLGGNVKTLGSKPDGSPWQVGIQDPNANAEGLGGSADAIARVACTGESVVTSGLYERVFEHGGVRYWHILDPRTGFPVETDVVSATIVSDESIDGDGFTKALFMMQKTSVEEFFALHPELQGLVIRSDGSMWTSDNSTIEMR